MNESNLSTNADASLDSQGGTGHSLSNPNVSHEKADYHPDRPEESSCSLHESATRLLRGGGALHFGSQQSEFAAAREAQLIVLADDPAATPPAAKPNFVGGEHQVFLHHPPVDVFKQTLPGFYGRILDEKLLLDPRTFMNKRMLAMRGALPSEYLLRWCVMEKEFGMQTDYLGVVRYAGEEPEMAIGQRFITESPDDPATEEDVTAWFHQYGFERVDAKLIVNPEIQDVTWYRKRDGLLVTDAHARNFRKELSGVLVPIDLVITVVPAGASKLLPNAEQPWQPS